MAEYLTLPVLQTSLPNVLGREKGWVNDCTTTKNYILNLTKLNSRIFFSSNTYVEVTLFNNRFIIIFYNYYQNYEVVHKGGNIILKVIKIYY